MGGVISRKVLTPPNLPKEFIMLPNERFALDCLQRYAENGDIIDATNGQFAHCPQPERYGDKGYYLTWEDHQHQGLLQSRDMGECCFFNRDTLRWLRECIHWPEGYFELWDIYDEYAGYNVRKLHEDRDCSGKSVFAMNNNKKIHSEKNNEGKSVVAVKAGTNGGPASARVRSKKVLVTFPDGSKQQFSSIYETSCFFCVTPMSIIFRIKKASPGKKGKLAGLRLEYFN